MINKDVIIVGGGPAGAACARRLRQLKVDCLILDRAHFPRPKVCAGWITPEVFEKLDVLPADYPYGLTNFASFKVSFPFGQFTLPVRQFAIRRIEFDDWLLRLSDAPFKQHEAKAIEQIDGRYVIDDKYACQFLVGAGGTACPVFRTVFNNAYPRNSGSMIAALEEEFPYDISNDQCHLWFFENHLPGYAWYVPKAGGVVNVGLGAKAAGLKARGISLMSRWQEFIESLDRAGLVSGHTYRPQGHRYYLRGKAMQARIGNAFIVGDAAGLATRDMGEGIRSAVLSGRLAAEAIASGGVYTPKSIPRYSLFSLMASGFGRRGIDWS